RPARPFLLRGNAVGSTPAEAVAADADAVPYRLAIAENEIEPAFSGADVDRAGRVTAVKHHGGARDRARSAGHAGAEEAGPAAHDVPRVFEEVWKALGLRVAASRQHHDRRQQKSKSPNHFLPREKI